MDMYRNRIVETFSKYTNYSYKIRLFNNLVVQDQYTNNHLLPYYLCLITPPEKIYPPDEEGKNPNFFDCNLRSLDEIAHYIRCFPYSPAAEARTDIWTSPDFLLKVRKGDVEDHSILMACLMMGIRKGNKQDEVTTDENSAGNFPYENRVFVCLGKLKNNRGNYVWIMTISDNYKDVIFWEPKTGTKYELKYRVDDPMRLKNFLEGKFFDYDSCKKNILHKPIVEKEESDDEERVGDNDKPKRRDFDDKKIPGTGEDDSFINYVPEDFNDNILHDEEVFNNNFDKIAAVDKKDEKKLNYNKQMGFYDDFICGKNTESKYKNFNYNFNAEQKEQMDKKMRSDGEQYLLPVDEFKDDAGVHLNNVLLPFETIDVIFNRRNIYANLQFHDPCHMKYNIYQKYIFL